MDLLLWRHAEAEDGEDDLQRRLTARGEKQAKAMARWLARHAPKKLRILASPAVRCQQTAAALDLSFETIPSLGPEASLIDLIEAAGWPNASGAVMIVGHQPTLGRLAALLLSGHEAEWTIKKGAVWWLLSQDIPIENAQAKLSASLPPNLVDSD